MTERKHLKSRVRERMSRTGETYTTARRQVVGSRSWGHHESALLRRGLAAVGSTWSEPMLCGLAGGIGFLYAVFEYAGHLPTVTVVTQHHPDPMVPAALARLSVPVSLSRTGSAAKALAALRAASGPRFCTVNRGALPWHPDAHPLAAADPYEVLVLDVSGETVLVSDVDETPSPLPVADFMAAWSTHRKGRHRLLAVTGPPAADLDLAAAVRDAVSVTVAHLTGPVLGNSFDANFGLGGMRRLRDQLGDPSTRLGWARRFASAEARSVALVRLHDCLTSEYGSAGATRPLYAAFLAEASAVLPGLDEVAPLYARAGSLWSSVATAAASGASFDSLASLVASAVAVEESAVASLAAVVSR